MKRRKAKYIEGEPGSRMYKIQDIEEYGLPIPDMFRSCFRCKTPAVYLHCFRAINYEGADWLPADPVTREFVEQIREWAGSNCEVPLCENHRESGFLVN